MTSDTHQTHEQTEFGQRIIDLKADTEDLIYLQSVTQALQLRTQSRGGNAQLLVYFYDLALMEIEHQLTELCKALSSKAPTLDQSTKA